VPENITSGLTQIREDLYRIEDQQMVFIDQLEVIHNNNNNNNNNKSDFRKQRSFAGFQYFHFRIFCQQTDVMEAAY